MANPRSGPEDAASGDEVLWTSDNPKHGVVRRVLFYGDFAARFDDLNSDFREVELSIFERGAAGWEKEYSQDDVDYPVQKEDAAVYGLSGGCQVYAYGRARPHARARIELYGGTWTVDVDADGWWLLVDDAPEEGFAKAMEAEDAERRSIVAEVAARNSSPDASGGSWAISRHVVYERPEDLPTGFWDSPLRVTIE
jgi:hypothetical protein